jgi:hypothetical protein
MERTTLGSDSENGSSTNTMYSSSAVEPAFQDGARF